MRTAFPQEYINPVTSLFGNQTPYTNDENTGWYKKGGDPEKAKQLLNEAGYAGEKVVILQHTNWAAANIMAQFLAATLRKIGLNVELMPADSAARLELLKNGSWSIFMTSASDFYFSDPVGSPVLSANGEEGWYGWPKSDEYEALRAKWANVETLQERQALAREMQQEYWNFVGTVLLGSAVSPIARRKTLTGVIGMPEGTAMWNMQKA